MRLATLCAQSEQAEGDLRKKLHDWGLSPTDTHHIIALLKQERYLNNERYARAYCRDKLRFNGWGRIKLAFMLKGKGIEQEHIDAALNAIDEEEYTTILNEALAAKNKSLKGKDRKQRRAALLRFASSRGFESSLIYNAVSRIISCDDED